MDDRPFPGNQQKESATPEGILNKKLKGAPPAEAIKFLKDDIARSGRDPNRAPKKVHEAGAGKPLPAKSNIIHIPGRNFVPDKGIHRELQQKVKGIIRPEDQDKEIIVIIQFEEGISLNQTIGLYELGLTYLDGIGDSAIIAKIPLSAVEKFKKLPFIRWIGEYKDEYKFNPAPSKSGKKGSYIYPLDTGRSEYEQSLKNLGIAVDHYNEITNSYYAVLDEGDFPRVAKLWWVRWIKKEPEEVPESEGFEPDDSRELINAPNTWTGYTGAGARVGVRDGGIWSEHPDLSGIFVTDSDLTVSADHGTHVAGIIAGRGTRDIEGQYDAKGVAYNASILFRNFNTSYSDAFSKFASNSVQISNHSYGLGNYSYDADTTNFDAYADDDDMIIVKSAGNAGSAAKTITNPGTGKNVVAVGALQYVEDKTSGRVFGDVANYSSRGPTQDDGRLKPEVVAPGGSDPNDWGYYRYGIVSLNDSSAADDGSSNWPTDPYYTRMSGTSMAAPHVAGALALYRQYNGTFTGYTEWVKAVMINTAIPIKANTNTASYGYANTNVGYGMMNPFSMIYNYTGESERLLGKIDWLTEGSNESDEWSFTVPAGTKKLLVTMAYNDEQGETSDTNALIDNLDLNLKAPGGNYYWGGYPSGATNEGTIEKMVVENPASGTWYAKVYFYSYPNNPSVTAQQRYGLVAHAIHRTPQLGVSASPASYYATRGQSLTITPTITNTGGYIAAGATLEISGSTSFTGDINTKKYAGNLMYQNHALNTAFNLVTPTTDGNYALTVKGNGINLGLGEVTQSIAVVVDETAPAQPIGLTASPSGWTTANSFSIDWTNPADTSGIAGAYYKRGSAPASPTDGTYTTGKPFTVSATAEGEQTIYVWLKDAAGNVNQNNRSSTLLKYDATPPSYPNSMTAAPTGWTNTNSFSINWTNPGDASGIAGAYYKLGSAPDSPTDGTYTTNKPFTASVTAECGQTIYVWLKDGAGNVTHLNKAWMTLYYDGTAPDAPTGIVATPGGWTNTNSFSINWTDPSAGCSGLAGAYYKVGSAPASPTDGTYVTSRPITVSATAEGGQTVYVWIKDGAGNVNQNNRGSVVIYYDATAPAAPISLNAAPGGWTGANSFSINWTNPGDTSGIAGAYYKLGSAPASPTDGTYTTNKPFTASATSQGGQTIYVWLKDVLGNVSHSNRSSTSLYYDGTAPSTAAVSDGTGVDIAYATSASQLSANWTAASDAQSGIARYWYGIGTAAGVTNVIGWKDNGLNTSTTSAGLSLANGQVYYFALKVENGAGLMSAITSSNGQKVDTTAPSGIITVNDGTGADAAYTTSASQLSANWTASSDDESGITRYWYAIGAAPGAADVAAWTDNGAGRSVTRTGLSLTSGQAYYFTVKAENGAGLLSPAAGSNGLTADLAAPNSSVSALNQYTNAASFSVQWSASDSGGSNLALAPYDVQYKAGAGYWTNWPGYTGTAAASAVFGPASPVTVQHGQTYYFMCRAKDTAGNIEAYPGAPDAFITVDLSSPSAPVVTSPAHQKDVWNITSNDPQFDWSGASDSGSGIAGYSYELHYSQSFTPDTALEPAGASKSYVDVPDGIWYFHIRTKDNAGNWSPTATYGAVKLDLTAPTFTAIGPSRDPAKGGQTTLTIVASEQMNESSATITQNGGPATNVPLASSDKITWSGVYDVISGFDGAAAINVSGHDLAGKPGSGSAVFQVDTIAPSTPAITWATHPENTPTSNNAPAFTWSLSADPGGSGVAGYSYAFNQLQTYDLDTTTETTAASVSSSTADGTYWFHLRGADNAGNGSEIVRYKFIVDVTSPVYITSYSHDPAKAGKLALTVNAGESLTQAPTVSVRQNGQSDSTQLAMTSSDNAVWTGDYTVVPGYDGTAAVALTGVDLANNTGTGNSSFQADTIEPSASITLSPGGSLRTGLFTLTLTITDATPINGTSVLTFSPPGQQPVAVPLTGSDKSWMGQSYIESTMSTGTAVFNFSAEDAAGNAGTAITAGGTFNIDTAVSSTTGGVVINSDNTGVDIPSGAYDGGSLIVTIGTPDSSLPDIVEADKNTPRASPVRNRNLCREFNAKNSVTGAAVTTFSAPVTLSVYYPDADNDGMVDGGNVRESKLKLFRLNAAGRRWEEVSGATPDFTSNKITAAVTHFSIYSILNVTPDSTIYPIPWKPGSGGNFDSPNIALHCPVSSLRSGILFDYLPAEAEIRIYNYQGDLLRGLKLTAADAGCKVWDGKNAAGRDVASGIYLAVIKTPAGGKTIRKLAIER